MISRLKAVIQQRRILRLLVARDLKVKYADAYLGYVWTILDPLLMALVFWFIFTQIISRGGIGAEPYILFLLAGLLPWNWFTGVVSRSDRAITGESKLVRSTSLPREIWVLRLVGSKFAEFILSIPVILAFMVIFRVTPNWYALALPLAVLIQMMLVTGLALLISSVTVLVGDLQRLVRVGVRIFFYASPIIYSAQDVFDSPRISQTVKVLYSLNPLVGIFDLYRAALFPAEFVGWWIVGVAALVSAITFVIGVTVFSRLESAVLKEL
ncbi:MAG TPA: ABC transporter permease [Candidatus Limnocylindria bacterium]|nr:ABC transporter permease [Candidatus Limnocylindria bacterium]